MQSPDKIIYMLDHKYSHANLSASASKSRDAHIIAILDTIAKEIGFCLGLANVEHTETGYADDNGCNYYRKKPWYDPYDDDPVDEDNVSMAEVEERNTTVENLVNLEGELISDNVDYDEELETIPSFNELFDGDSWDDQEYEGYQGNVCILLLRRRQMC